MLKLPERFKFYIRVYFTKLTYPIYKKERDNVFQRCIKDGVDKIPIFILSYNRVSYIKRFVQQLENIGITNINIIDNNSSYPPLLDYYKRLPYKIFYMEKNEGHMVFWNNEVFSEYRKNFYVVTDPDLEIIRDCPTNFMNFFLEKLWKYPFVRKVGFSLKIDDLPADGCLVEEALAWEKQYYKTFISKDNLYYAGIDTTFALYLPESLVKNQKFLSAFRTGYPYQARHLPWYKSRDKLTEEDKYYSDHKSNGWWDNVKGLTPK